MFIDTKGNKKADLEKKKSQKKNAALVRVTFSMKIRDYSKAL